MSKFLEILNKALSDPKYGYSDKKKEPKEKQGYYGNEDRLYEQWLRDRKENFW